VILPKSYPVLYAVAKTLTEHPELLKVRVEGHTDSKGSDSYNQQLSEKRAKAIVKFLVLEAAIEPQRLEFVGWGEAQPIAPNDNEENMERNRRVEFIIVDPP
jgi:outer membrane protein OmpA-like peptidoglycan-associated protein